MDRLQTSADLISIAIEKQLDGAGAEKMTAGYQDRCLPLTPDKEIVWPTAAGCRAFHNKDLRECMEIESTGSFVQTPRWF